MSVTRKAPTPVPATPALGLKASRKISPKVGPTSPMLRTMTIRAPVTYTTAIMGARIDVTRPIREMPPSMTAPTTADVIRPLVQVGMLNWVSRLSATVFAWIALPVRKAVMPRMKAKKMAIHFQFGPRPRSM